MSDASKFTHVLGKDARASLILSLTELWEETAFALGAEEVQQLNVHFEACEWGKFEDYLCVILVGMPPSDAAIRVAILIVKAAVLRASKR